MGFPERLAKGCQGETAAHIKPAVKPNSFSSPGLYSSLWNYSTGQCVNNCWLMFDQLHVKVVQMELAAWCWRNTEKTPCHKIIQVKRPDSELIIL